MPAVKVFLGIGSNVGDRAAAIKKACGELSSFLEHFEQASLYETRPREIVDQPLFLNTVAAGRTSLAPADLLVRINDVERQLGRNRPRERRKGPRTIDIDLLLYGTEVIESDDLIVPHPRITERKFVLLPLLELAPLLTLPTNGVPLQQYLDSLGSQGIYYFQATSYSREVS